MADGQERDELDAATLTASLGYLLRRLQLAYRKHFTRVAGPDGVSPNHVGAMYVIGLNPGVTPTRIGTALGLDGAQVATMLNALEQRGLVARKISRADGRSRAVHLTAAGRRAFATVQAVAEEAEASFVAGRLDAAETRQLIGLMSRLLAGHGDG